jgi:predicted phage terminase large subunit-like protein
MIFEKHLMLSLQKSPAAIARTKWLSQARSNQITPKGDWRAWLVLAGRGFGKTRTGAEDVAWYAACNPNAQIAVVAPTFNDVRGTCFEGVSGLMSCIPHESIAEYNRSRQEIRLANGALIRGFSADTPDRLRGPQFHRAWCDELAAWTYPEAFDQLAFGLRLGENPQLVATTTPRPTKVIRDLLNGLGTIVTRGSTFDNAANLAPTALAALRDKYEGTRLGRQELFAEILEDIDGAIWTREMILRGQTPQMQRIVVGVDPSGGGDEIGIVVAGKGIDGRFYILEDASCSLGPAGWGRMVIERYHHHKADKIVAERNFGGDMVESIIKTSDRFANVEMVTASKGKAVRAEPIAALYEQGRVTHAAQMPRLEDQMMQMTAQGFMGDGSPDRLDAMVWALTDLAFSTTGRPNIRAL